jgi:hypothetical protein
MARGPSRFQSLGSTMNLIAVSCGVSLLAVGLAHWVASLSELSDRLMQEDKFLQAQARIATRTVTLIQKQNRILDALDLSCVASAVLAPSSLATIRNSGRLIARLQDNEWQQVRLKLRTARRWQRSDFSQTLRAPPRGCAPGRFEWKDRRLIGLESAEAGIEVSMVGNTPRWHFSNPRVVRRLR